MNQRSQLQNVDHITLAVSDIAKTLHWYQTSFACNVLEQSTTRGVLEFGNLRIVLVLPSQQPQHLAFEREDAKTFGPLAPSDDGRLSLYLSDPAGSLVEIIQPNEKQL